MDDSAATRWQKKAQADQPMKTHRDRSPQPLMLMAGWLFADLLLALGMLFLVGNTVGIIKPPPTPTPTTPPTPTIMPTATPILRLETRPDVIYLTTDTAGLLSGSSSARQSLINGIKGHHELQGKRAGLVIVSVGAPTASDTGTAKAVGQKVDAILQQLGNAHFVFVETSYHDPLFLLGQSASLVKIEVYLYAKQ